MAEFKRYVGHDGTEGRSRRRRDTPPIVDLRQSITETRRVYRNMSDEEFSGWYSVRYGVRMEAVLAVVRGGRRNGQN